MDKLDKTYHELMEKMNDIGIQEEKHQKRIKRIQRKRFLKAKRNYYIKNRKNEKNHKKKPYFNKYKEAKRIKHAMENNSIKTYHPESVSNSSDSNSSKASVSTSSSAISKASVSTPKSSVKTSLKSSNSNKSHIKSLSNKSLTPLQKAEKKLKQKWQNH